MANLFRRAATRIPDSPFVIPLFFVFAAMFVIACGISIEDYSTSLAGYRLLPTAKFNEWVIPLVALLPQVGQVGLAYIFANDTDKRWSILLAAVFHLADLFSDVYFKAYGQPLAVWLLAVAETEFVYTLGSEILLVLSFGMLMQLTPRFIEQAGTVLSAIGESLMGDREPSRPVIDMFDRPGKKRENRPNGHRLEARHFDPRRDERQRDDHPRDDDEEDRRKDQDWWKNH